MFRASKSKSAKDRRPSWNRWLASLTWAWQWALWTAVPLGSEVNERKWRSRAFPEKTTGNNGFWGSNFRGFHQNAEVNLYRISDLLSTQSLSCVGEVFCRNVSSLQSRTPQLASLVYSYVAFWWIHLELDAFATNLQLGARLCTAQTD